MAINERLVHTASASAAAGTGNQEEGLMLHLDANDVDSYDGDGDVWYDIHDHEYTPATNVSEHFNTVLYTGDGNADRDITGVGFTPDLVWTKNRSTNDSHQLYDSLRGNYGLYSNGTDAQFLITDWEIIDDGFDLGAANNGRNGNGNDIVAWCFKAGGLINKAAYFNGSSSYVNLPSNPISGTGDYSVSVWAKCDNLSAGNSGQQYITQFGSIASSGGGTVIAKWATSTGSANKIYIHVGGGYVLTSHVVVLGAWTHYAITQTGTSILFYVNGNLHDTLTAPSSPNRTSGNSSIGYYNEGSHSYFGGNIQQVRIFNSVLTSSQITQLYNETPEENNGHLLGCVAAYPLGENANDVGGLYNGTASNVNFGLPGYANRNNEGTIESTVSANNDLGFSIVKYTATGVTATVGHGLDTPAEMIIAKTTNQAYNWMVYHKDLGASNYLMLNSRNASASSSAFMNSTSPTSSVFTAGAGQNLNYANNDQIVAYNFTSKRGVSKVGSYIGNGTTNNKIYTGFEPAFFMLKNTSLDNTGWLIKDNVRGENSKTLLANANTIEYDTTAYWTCDFERDGVRLTYGADNEFNRNGDTYIFYAVAKDTNAGSLTPSTDGTEIETDLIFDPTKVNYYGNYALEQNNTVWRGNSSKSIGQNEGEVYVNNYFESGDTGKYYFEVKCLESSGQGGVGFTDPTKYIGGDGASQTSFRNNQLWGLSAGSIQTGGYASATTFANSTNSTNEVTAIAIDVATRKVWMGRVLSGSITWYNSGDPSGGTNPLVTLPSNYNIYQPLAYDGSYSGSSARYAFWKIHTEAEASSLPTGFSYMTGAIKNADLELHLDASTYTSGSTWTDSSGNGNNGTITGATHNNELGDFFDLDGSGDYIDIPTSGVFTGDFTVEMWWNFNTLSPPSGSAYRMLLGASGYSGGSGLGHYIENNRLRTWVSVNGSTSNVLNGSGTDLTTNKWQHVVLTRSGGTYTQYIDTNQVGQASGTTASLDGTNSRIGGHYNVASSHDINAKVGQVRLYSTALSQAQIRQNYNFTKPKYPNEFNGTISNATWNAGGYFNFDGSNDKIATTYTKSGTAFSFSCWVNTTDDSQRRYVFGDFNSGGADASGSAFFQITAGDDLLLGAGNGSLTNSINLTDGMVGYLGYWTHLAVTIDGTSGKIYRNGTLVKSGTFSISMASGQNPICIGHYSGGASGGEFNGSISDVKMFDKALTASEVTAQYNIGYNGIG